MIAWRNYDLEYALNLKLFSLGRHAAVLFTDEKLFTIEQCLNRRNNQILARMLFQRPTMTRMGHPAPVVWAAIMSTGKTPGFRTLRSEGNEEIP